MKKILFILLTFLSVSCSQKKFQKNFADFNLFPDGFKESSGLIFFNLLDGYPTLKRALKSVEINDFNRRLNLALQEIHPIDITGALRAVQFLFLEAKTTLQSTLKTTNSLINRVRTGNESSYNVLLGYLEKLRVYPKGIIRGLIPFSGEFLLSEYRSKNSETIQNLMNGFANELKTTNVKNLFIKTEDIAYKGIFQNSNVRSGVEEVLNGASDSSLLTDKTFSQNVVNLSYGLGDMMNKLSGFSDSKTPENVFKELIINLEDYNTSGGAYYTSEYSDATYSSELETFLTDVFVASKKLIITPSGLTKSTVSSDDSSQTLILASELTKNLSKFDFTTSMSDVDESLKNLIKYDYKGLDRSYSNNGSSVISALESLFFVLAVVDSYGYVWEDTVSCSNNTGCTNWITAATGGIMSVGDTLWSLQSIIRSSDTFNFKNILKLSSESRNIFKNDVELSTTNSKAVNINTYVLKLLEKESIGATQPIESSTADSVYVKTVPWVMNWMKKVIYEGYGPYYNKNKKDSSGNFLSPDGSIYITDSTNSSAKYKSSWTTGDYEICLEKSGSIYRWVGLGGRESDGTTVTHPANCNAGITAPSNNTWKYTIKEITKTDSERAVDSDEEAFYKNFQWLLYEKRFVVIIPARAKLHSSVQFNEALFILAIGNGLKGMMGLKPNCGPNNSLTDCGSYNGVWNSDTTTSKTLKLKEYNSKDTDLQTFSDVAGDSVLFIEGWGYGTDGTSTTLTTTLVLPTLVYPLLIPDPTSVFGLIPPVVSQHFDVLERLGFFTSNKVKPSEVSSYWASRNKLTPLVVALAKTLDDQVDASAGKNPHSILTDLSKILARPYYYSVADPVSSDTTTQPTNSSPPTIPHLRVAGLSSTTGLRSPSMTSGEYLPNKNYRSVISLLSEKTRKYQDGALNLVGKTNLLTGLVKMLATLGSDAKLNARKQIMSGLRKVVNEIKVDADSPSTSQYNIQSYFKELKDRIAAYPDTRSTNLDSSDWDGVNDSVAFFRDYLSSTSQYSLTKSLEFALTLISDIPPSSSEVTALLDVVGSILTNSDGSRNYRITSIFTNDIPEMIYKMAPYGRNTYAMMGSLGKPGSYVSFLEEKMSFSPYLINDMIIDLERLTVSDMIQRTSNDEFSLLYSGGTLIKLFADIYQFGRKLDTYGFPFADGLNLDDTSGQANYWNRLNMILSSK
ncbi:MAG: hypothetical protein KDK36_19720 [Leptospiraceae bacterium]|nr:hypothetical protein [Leptospiraceae bacterium]